MPDRTRNTPLPVPLKHTIHTIHVRPCLAPSSLPVRTSRCFTGKQTTATPPGILTRKPRVHSLSTSGIPPKNTVCCVAGSDRFSQDPKTERHDSVSFQLRGTSPPEFSSVCRPLFVSATHGPAARLPRGLRAKHVFEHQRQ